MNARGSQHRIPSILVKMVQHLKHKELSWKDEKEALLIRIGDMNLTVADVEAA